MEAVFLKILNMGITASWVIFAVVILRLVLKKAPKWIVCLLWALVALRLVCPFSIESALSLIPSSEPLPREIITENTFQINTGIGAMDEPVNDYLGDHYYEGVSVSADNGNHIMFLSGIIWTAGIVLLMLYGFVSYYRLHRLTRASLKLEKNIFLCDAIDTPFILGIIRPRIYLPSGMEKEQAEYVIAHERAHLKRKDHIWKPAGFVLLSVYWFQPLCWLSYILLCRDIELACDEHVIRELGQESKKPYAEVLLSCSIKRNMVSACPLAFGEVGVRERVKNVLHYKKPAFWIILAAVICCIVAAVCFLTSPKEEGESISYTEETAAYMVEVQARAEQYAKEAYQAVLDSPSNYDYTDWRVKYWEHCYTYDDLEGKTYELYRFDYEFLSASPEDVVLAGGMSISGDGWVVPDYPDSKYIVLEKDGEQREFVSVLFENDCMPGDEMFSEDLLAAVREKERAEAERNAEDGQDSLTDGREEALLDMLTSWQTAFCARDAEEIADMVTPELAAEMLEGSEGSYSFGISSPWPWDEETDSYIYDYDEETAVIYYYAMTSDPHITCWREDLEYEWKNDKCVITGEELTYYDYISTGEEFEEAYHGYLDGTMMDYTRNGLGESLNENALLSSSTVYRDLFEPERAAAFLLNLSDDPGDIRYTLHEPERSGLIGLDITFLKDRETYTISMYQPYGESGIWVPMDYRIDVVARFMDVPWDQVKNIRFSEGIPDTSGILCIGEIPEKKIKVYGYNDEEAGLRGVAIEIGDDVNYFDWFYSSPQTILPDLYWDEARRQLQISCHIYTGTGASADELHVLQQYDTGTLLESGLSLEDYRAHLEERIDYNFDEETRKLVLTDTETGEELAAVTVPEEVGEKVTGLELGMISDFELGENIYFRVTPGYIIDDMFGIAQYDEMPKLQFELVMTQGDYGDISFGLGKKIL
ncbi:MAG: hypothetical protein HDQ96_01535 [Lachnospiraceae bacterium]|nr:hypothetical protein [Lachnospiraceae bacterium]